MLSLKQKYYQMHYSELKHILHFIQSRILDQRVFIVGTAIEDYAEHLHDQVKPFAKSAWGHILPPGKITD